MRADEGTLGVGQKLTEAWEIEFTMRHRGGRIEARVRDWPYTTHYAVCGYGDTPEQARLDLVLRLAACVAEDRGEDRPALEADSLARLRRAAKSDRVTA